MNYKRTILHVDDDPQITRIVAARLNALGYEVTSLNDPRQALEELSRSQQRLVLLDIDMPHVNGLDLLQEIRAEYGGTQVIMLTGLVSMQILLQSFRCGAEFCMFKPITDMEPLLEVIDKTFWKIDQWGSALDHLSREKRSERYAAMQASEEAELQTTSFA
ncbi:MAG: response regulator [Candidatus Nealsonbacteria bacterium]|nr:response regulator [Candidatus Nealsonbacteria bacterium]